MKTRKQLEDDRDDLEEMVAIMHSHIHCNEKRLQVEVDIEKRKQLQETIAKQKVTLGEDFYELLKIEHKLVLMNASTEGSDE